MKLALNIALSLLMLVVCTWLVWPNPHDRASIEATLLSLRFATFWPYLAGYLGLMLVTHVCRAWRWNNLLAPLDVKLPPGRLMAISSVGFMAIFALPARMGEFVRPALIREKGRISASAALGTVAVERIVDGLMVSLFVFGALFAHRGPNSPSWMMMTAYSALGIFLAALAFLILALRYPKRFVRFCVACTLLPRFSPKLAEKLAGKVDDMISGFKVLTDKKNLAIFILWSVVYWFANGLSMWVLAEGFHLELSPVGAFATMGLLAVGITLPNAPGLAGQFQYFTCLGLGLYIPQDLANTTGKAYAIVLHVLQGLWYIGAGLIALASPYVSMAEVVKARELPDDLANDSVSRSE